MKKFIFSVIILALSYNVIYAQDYALQFDGNNEYVTTTYSSGIQTLSFWFKTDDFDQHHSLFGQRYDSNEESGNWQMHWDEQGNQHLRIYAYDSNGDGDEMLTNTAFETGKWYHVAVTSDGTTLKYSVNGELDSSHSWDIILGAGNNDDGLYIGGSGENGSIESFNGTIDEVKIWDEVRTEAEIQEYICSGLSGTETNLIAYYTMSDGSGSTLTDNSSNSYTGTLHNMEDGDWVTDYIVPTGDGTSGTPYQIAGFNNLYWLSQTSSDWDKYFEQSNDIDLLVTQNWNDDHSGDAEGFSPIGSSSTDFTGSYDGGGYTIDNLYINRSSDEIALFGQTNGATITKIGVTNADITGDSYVGGLVGNHNEGGTVSYSYTTGSVYGTSTFNTYVGGIVGDNSGSISNSYSTASVSGEDDIIGGLVGAHSGTISQCYATGLVSGDNYIGGLVGNNSFGEVNNSFWDTETSGQSSSDGGTGKSTVEMQTRSTFTDAGWDFAGETANGTEEIWSISSSYNTGYPNLDDVNANFWSGDTDSDWATGSNWESGSIPTSSNDVRLISNATNNPVINAGAECNDLTVESGASLVGQEYLTVNGIATIQREIEGYSVSTSDGWHLLSSPVNNMTIANSDFEPDAGAGNDDFYAWEESSYMWLNYEVGSNNIDNFENGTGYLIAYQNTATREFTGDLNTSDVTVSGLTDQTSSNDSDYGWNLVGNPFTSAIQWADGNWDLTNFQATAKIRDESGGNYIDITSDGTNIIPVNQGFFVQAINDGVNLTIPLDAQIHDGQGFYKNDKEPEGFLKLKVSANENSFYDIQTIRLHESSDESYDKYDSEKFYGNENAPQLYSIDDDLGILSTHSVHPSSIDGTRIFPLGFEAVDGEYTVSLDMNTLGEEYSVTLEDTKADKMIDFSEQETYTFSAQEGDEVERFHLHLKKSAIGIPEDSELQNTNIYANNHNVYIQTSDNLTNSTVFVYNTLGQLVVQKDLNNDYRVIGMESKGAYIVKVSAEEGTVTEKVIIH
ncbi:MAG: T9SS type A sorting domain-containing protein [Bacteroidales bacterium]|nr:T9SS type A sorting domain-containing protein [Bacteroidales bacterium]